jgi:hypothetical protein
MNDSLAHAKDALGLGKLICDILEQVDLSGIVEENTIQYAHTVQSLFKLGLHVVVAVKKTESQCFNSRNTTV